MKSTLGRRAVPCFRIASIGALLLVAGATLSPGPAWLMRQADGQSVPEMRSQPRSMSAVDLTSSAAGLFSSTAPAAAGNVQAPRRQLAESAALASNQFGQDVAHYGSQTVMKFAAMLNPVVIDDDWQRVTPTTGVPWRSVCLTYTVWPHKGPTLGTASFVGRRVLLTNAHNVFDKSAYNGQGAWYSSIMIVPGRDRDLSPFGAAYALTAYVPGGYASAAYEDRFDYDISWLILPTAEMYNRLGYAFGYSYGDDWSASQWDLNSLGYPGTKYYEQWRDFETQNQAVYPNVFVHYHDMTAGSSGSPMYVIYNGARFIVGVNAAESVAYGYNLAVRINYTYFYNTKYYTQVYP